MQPDPTTPELDPAVAAGIFGTMMLFALIAYVVMALILWKVFTKAGQPGWAALVPIYNGVVWLKIAGRPWWWIILFIIPVVGFVVAIIATVDFAKSYGKGAGFAIFGLLIFSVIGYAILAFGDAQYRGPAALAGAAPQPAY